MIMLEQVLSNTEVIIQTSSERLRKAQPRRTTTTLLTEPNDNNQGARLLITEKEYTPRRDQQWVPQGKTLHLTLKSNASHIQIIGYIRRDEVKNNRQLGDILCLEAEQLSAALEDTDNLGKEAAL